MLPEHGISFNHHKLRLGSKLDVPFIEQLSLFNGCVFSILEILWKYYRALHLINQKSSTSTACAALADPAAVNLDPDGDYARDRIMIIVRDKLSDDNLI